MGMLGIKELVSIARAEKSRVGGLLITRRHFHISPLIARLIMHVLPELLQNAHGVASDSAFHKAEVHGGDQSGFLSLQCSVGIASRLNERASASTSVTSSNFVSPDRCLVTTTPLVGRPQHRSTTGR